MSEGPPLSVVVVSWNTAELTRRCLAALAAHPYRGGQEVIVVDNASADGSPDRVAQEFPWVRLLRSPENLGYSGGNNLGLRAARGRFLMLLNSDTEVRPGALDRLVAFIATHPEAGAVTARLLNPDGTLQPSCMRFPTWVTALVFDTPLARLPWGRRHLDRYFMRDFDHRTTREVEQIPGTCLLTRRDVLDRVGLLDETLWLFFNDVDLCRRIRAAGWKLYFVAEAEILHHHGASTGRFTDFAVEWHRNRIAYYRKHFGPLSVPLTKGVALYVGLRELLRYTFRREGYNVRYVLRGLKRVLAA